MEQFKEQLVTGILGPADGAIGGGGGGDGGGGGGGDGSGSGSGGGSSSDGNASAVTRAISNSAQSANSARLGEIEARLGRCGWGESSSYSDNGSTDDCHEHGSLEKRVEKMEGGIARLLSHFNIEPPLPSPSAATAVVNPA